MMNILDGSAWATVITAVGLMIAAMALGLRWMLTGTSYPNYPAASVKRRSAIAGLGVTYAFLSVYRFNSPFHPGGFEIDAFGAVASVVMAAYHAIEAVELLQSRLPTFFWRNIARAKSLARCGLCSRRKRGDARGVRVEAAAIAASLEGFTVAGPLERWRPPLDDAVN